MVLITERKSDNSHQSGSVPWMKEEPDLRFCTPLPKSAIFIRFDGEVTTLVPR